MFRASTGCRSTQIQYANVIHGSPMSVETLASMKPEVLTYKAKCTIDVFACFMRVFMVAAIVAGPLAESSTATRHNVRELGTDSA